MPTISVLGADITFDWATIIALIGLIIALIAYYDSHRRGNRTKITLKTVVDNQEQLIRRQDASLEKHDQTIAKQDDLLRDGAEMNLQLKASVLQMADLINTQGLLLERTSKMHDVLIRQEDATHIQQEVKNLEGEIEKKKEKITATLDVIYDIKDQIGLSEKVTVMKYDKDGRLYEDK